MGSSGDTHLLCSECLQRLAKGELLYAVFAQEFEPSKPLEKGFSWLFKAARVLLREGITDEDQIISTLALAHEFDCPRPIKEDILRPIKGEEIPPEALGTFFPTEQIVVKEVDGVFIVERDPVSALILVQRSLPGKEDSTIPRGVLIRVRFHKKTVEPERVASVYREQLAIKGISYEGSHSASMKFDLVGNELYLAIMLRKEMAVSRLVFPPPRLVGEFYGGLMKDFGKRLTTHGREFEADNLIPACVAFFLRASAGIRGRKDVHRLLNDHVFCEKKLPEDGYANTSEVVQLWKDVPKAGERLARSLSLARTRPIFPNSFDPTN